MLSRIFVDEVKMVALIVVITRSRGYFPIERVEHDA